MINWYNEDIDFPKIDVKKIETWLSSVIDNEGYIEGEISYILCSDKHIIEINKEYLNHDYPTDIITFNYVENKIVSTDIFISLETVADNAKSYNVSFINEFLRVLVHGILHLVGYDDKTDEEQEIMTQKEDFYLNTAPA